MNIKITQIIFLFFILNLFFMSGCKEGIKEGEYIPPRFRGTEIQRNETCNDFCMRVYGAGGVCLDNCNKDYPNKIEEKCGSKVCCCKERIIKIPIQTINRSD